MEIPFVARRLAKVKIRFGEPINAQELVLDELDEDAAYQKVTAELKRRIQQMLDEMRVTGEDPGIPGTAG